jgi:hypothetical protein
MRSRNTENVLDEGVEGNIWTSRSRNKRKVRENRVNIQHCLWTARVVGSRNMKWLELTIFLEDKTIIKIFA